MNNCLPIVLFLIILLIVVLFCFFSLPKVIVDDLLEDTEICLEIQKLTIELDREMVNQTVIDTCAKLIKGK